MQLLHLLRYDQVPQRTKLSAYFWDSCADNSEWGESAEQNEREVEVGPFNIIHVAVDIILNENWPLDLMTLHSFLPQLLCPLRRWMCKLAQSITIKKWIKFVIKTSHLTLCLQPPIEKHFVLQKYMLCWTFHTLGWQLTGFSVDTLMPPLPIAH